MHCKTNRLCTQLNILWGNWRRFGWWTAASLYFFLENFIHIHNLGICSAARNIQMIFNTSFLKLDVIVEVRFTACRV